MSGTPLWTGAEAIAAMSGSGAADWSAQSVSIDTRTLAAGALFVAIAGPTFDGHDFVADAFARGAAAAVVSREPANVAPNAPLVKVADTLIALADLGRAARARTTARVIAVTGSVGKTSIKEALRHVLALQGETAANEGSLNNHWGVPLSLARLPRQARYAVVEIGMNHAGEITPLSLLTQPDVAVITTIAPAHLGHFSSLDAICDAKAEIFAGVVDGGSAVLNRDNPFFDRLASAGRARGIGRIIGFGRHPDADVRLISAELDADGARVRADALGTVVDYRLNVAGNHAVENTLCVLAAAVAVGADVPSAAAGISGVRPAYGRGQRFFVHHDGGRFEVIDDSYNASPASMLASFEVLGRIAPAAEGRRIAILGDMLELGDETLALHRGLAPALRRHAVDLVFAAGPAMAELFDAVPVGMRGGHAATSAALVASVTAAVRPGDVVVVKGSAGSKMATIVKALRALDEGDDGTCGQRRRGGDA